MHLNDKKGDIAVGKVAQYLEQIFLNLPKSEEVLRYRENLEQQMEVVFRAECASGKTEEEALRTAIHAAPDYEGICAAIGIFENSEICDAAWYVSQVRWCNFWFSFALGLFVLSPCALIALSVWKYTYNLVAGLAVLIFAFAIGTGILLCVQREKRLLRGKVPNAPVKPVRVRFLFVGIFFFLLAAVVLAVYFTVFEGKALSWECASSLIYIALGVMAVSYFIQGKRWLKP